MNRSCTLAPFFLLATAAVAQTGMELPVFRPPMDIPMELSGNFMELRSNHFHSGLDLRTNGQEGQPVRAVADGWVSRIKISPWGYGKAVYIDHPSGYTTVYAHLRDLVGNVHDAAFAAQYREKCFDIDIYLPKGQVPVTAGQQIAHSGNTGGSGGPHLHFEVRNSGNQHALDPELFGLKLLDKVPPTLHGLRIDALDSAARVAPYPANSVGHAFVARNDSSYVLREGARTEALGNVGLSVNVTDRYSNGTAKCGIRQLEIRVDGKAVFSAVLDHVDFSTNRYANAYMDFALFKQGRMDYNRCYRLPNNKLKVYGKEPEQGLITVEAGRSYAVEVIATDANGNRSTGRFTLKGADPATAAAWRPATPVGELFKHDQANTLSTSGAHFALPAAALYSDTYLTVDRDASTTSRNFAPWFRLHDPYTPLQKAGKLTLELSSPAPEGLSDKLVMVRRDHKGKVTAIGGSYADGKMSAETREFGAFSVVLDTVAAKVTNVDLKPSMAGRKTFKLRIDDDLSGVGTYNGYLNGKWILLEYDPKTKTLLHVFDQHSTISGKNELRVEASDERRNKSTFSYTFTR